MGNPKPQKNPKFQKIQNPNHKNIHEIQNPNRNLKSDFFFGFLNSKSG
jgi:hypothetical protein